MTDLLRRLGNNAANCWSTSRGIERCNANGSYTLLLKCRNLKEAKRLLEQWGDEIRRYAPNPPIPGSPFWRAS
jgi:hypothetical protein